MTNLPPEKDLGQFIAECELAKAQLMNANPARFMMTQAKFDLAMDKCHTQEERMLMAAALMTESLHTLTARLIELKREIDEVLR